jgi:hypothetical protein
LPHTYYPTDSHLCVGDCGPAGSGSVDHRITLRYGKCLLLCRRITVFPRENQDSRRHYYENSDANCGMFDFHSRIYREWLCRWDYRSACFLMLTIAEGRVWRQTFSNTKEKISQMTSTLLELKASFDSGLAVQTAFLSMRTSQKVESMC